MTTHAIVRTPGTTLARGLTTARLGPPSYDLAIEQHQAYVACLRDLGIHVTVLPALDAFPDAHFIEDSAVVLPDVAVLTRSGAASRRGEPRHVAEPLSKHRPLRAIAPPGLLDGGDVLRMGTHYLIGLSERTNAEGAAQLGDAIAAHGGTWETLAVGDGLHLKSSANRLGSDVVLATEALAKHGALRRWRVLRVPEGETYAANVLEVDGTVLVPDGFPATRRMIDEAGFGTRALAMSEAEKLDGGLTCLSLRFQEWSG